MRVLHVILSLAAQDRRPRRAIAALAKALGRPDVSLVWRVFDSHIDQLWMLPWYNLWKKSLNQARTPV